MCVCRGRRLPSGVSAGGGGCLPRGGVCTPPPVNRITDRCKNIIFLQLRLRTVMIAIFEFIQVTITFVLLGGGEVKLTEKVD